MGDKHKEVYAMESVVYLTKKGIKELKKSITQLEHKHSQLQVSLRDHDRTTKHDDRLAYTERMVQLDVLEAEIAEKKLYLQNAKQLPKRSNSLTVIIGSAVDLIDRYGKRQRYTLVDSLEADPSKGKISVSSPLGSSLVGKKMRDVVRWSTGRGERKMTLVGIS